MDSSQKDKTSAMQRIMEIALPADNTITEICINIQNGEILKSILQLVERYGNKEEVEMVRDLAYTYTSRGFTAVKFVTYIIDGIRRYSLYIGNCLIPAFPVIKKMVKKQVDDKKTTDFAAEYTKSFAEKAECEENLKEAYDEYDKEIRRATETLMQIADAITNSKKNSDILKIIASLVSTVGAAAVLGAIISTGVGAAAVGATAAAATTTTTGGTAAAAAAAGGTAAAAGGGVAAAGGTAAAAAAAGGGGVVAAAGGTTAAAAAATGAAAGAAAVAVGGEAAAIGMGTAVSVVGGVAKYAVHFAEGRAEKRKVKEANAAIKNYDQTTDRFFRALDEFKQLAKNHLKAADQLGELIVRFKKLNKDRVRVTLGIGDSIEEEVGYVNSYERGIKWIEGKEKLSTKIFTIGGEILIRAGNVVAVNVVVNSSDAAAAISENLNALRIAGVASCVAVITIDIVSIVKTAINLSKGSPNTAATLIREAALELQKRRLPELREISMKALSEVFEDHRLPREFE